MPAQSIFKSADSPRLYSKISGYLRFALRYLLANNRGRNGKSVKKNPHGPFYIVSRNLRKKLSTFVIELQTYNRLKRSIRSIKRRFFNIPSGQSCRRKRV